MLKLLKPEISSQVEGEFELISGLDKYLRGVLTQDGFIWEAEIEMGFPQAEYWYLYGKLPFSPLK